MDELIVTETELTDVSMGDGGAISQPTMQTVVQPETEQSVKSDKLKTIGFYRQALAKNLSPEIFKPNPWRIAWFAFFIFGAIGCALAIITLPMIWPLKLLLGLALGFCNGTLGFICHELLHGSIIKNQKVQHVLAFFAATPFFISPTFWKFWHNRLHHGKTQQLIKDPDAFPNLRIYKASKFMKFMFPFTPGSGHKRSFTYFFFWFSFHNFVAQVYLRFRNKIFSALNQKQVTIEFAGQLMIALAVAVYAGPANWFWIFIVPLTVQNYLLMSYIATNHNLSPLTSENDPLVNSLSVTNHPFIEYLNLGFGYHVEHHIFPSVSGAHVKAIHRELVKQFPQSYHVMPKWQAMKALYTSARIYKNAHELINPETMSTYPTLE